MHWHLLVDDVLHWSQTNAWCSRPVRQLIAYIHSHWWEGGEEDSNNSTTHTHTRTHTQKHTQMHTHTHTHIHTLIVLTVQTESCTFEHVCACLCAINVWVPKVCVCVYMQHSYVMHGYVHSLCHVIAPSTLPYPPCSCTSYNCLFIGHNHCSCTTHTHTHILMMRHTHACTHKLVIKFSLLHTYGRNWILWVLSDNSALQAAVHTF